MNAMQAIDLDQLALVTGGADGRFERAGGQVGEELGRWAAGLVPKPYRPPAQIVLPPVGRAIGETAGRYVDRWLGN